MTIIVSKFFCIAFINFAGVRKIKIITLHIPCSMHTSPWTFPTTFLATSLVIFIILHIYIYLYRIGRRSSPKINYHYWCAMAICTYRVCGWWVLLFYRLWSKIGVHPTNEKNSHTQVWLRRSETNQSRLFPTQSPISKV